MVEKIITELEKELNIKRLEGMLLCQWKKVSNKGMSTTFEDVKDVTHPLYNCKFVCKGYDLDCDNYVTIKNQTYELRDNKDLIDALNYVCSQSAKGKHNYNAHKEIQRSIKK